MSARIQGRQDYPLYQSAVQAYLSNQSATFRRLRRSRKLSADERRLLAVRALFWDRKWAEARSELERVSAGAGTFLGGDRSFLRATSHFQEGDFESAACANIEALRSYEACADRRGRFLSAHNLMVDFSRMGSLKLSRSYFIVAENCAIDEHERALLYRAQACESSRHRRYEEACRWLERIFQRIDAMAPHDQEVTFNVAADIYFRAGRLDDAARALDRIRRQATRNRDQGRLCFEQALLELHRKGGPLGPVPPSVFRCREYSLKWDLLRALQSGEQERASALWDSLREMAPGLFGESFTCKDPSEADSAYFAAIRRLRMASAAPVTAPSSGKLALLHRALLEARSPIRKEELIERIWGVRYHPSWEPRLYKLIERGKKSSLPIVSSQRAYSLARRQSY